MVFAGIKGEKKCTRCECTFVNKVNPDATLCSSCEGHGPGEAGMHEQFIYQDIKRSDIEAKLNLCLSKLDTVLKLLGMKEPKPKEYSHKCATCGQVFVSDAAASQYCDGCKESAKK